MHEIRASVVIISCSVEYIGPYDYIDIKKVLVSMTARPRETH